MSKVYFASARAMKWKYDDSMPGKLEKLLKEFNLPNYFEPKELVAVKTHFGSEGAHRIVRPVFFKKGCRYIEKYRCQTICDGYHKD